jgi:hypothetical protein
MNDSFLLSDVAKGRKRYASFLTEPAGAESRQFFLVLRASKAFANHEHARPQAGVAARHFRGNSGFRIVDSTE